MLAGGRKSTSQPSTQLPPPVLCGPCDHVSHNRYLWLGLSLFNLQLPGFGPCDHVHSAEKSGISRGSRRLHRVNTRRHGRPAPQEARIVVLHELRHAQHGVRGRGHRPEPARRGLLGYASNTRPKAHLLQLPGSPRVSFCTPRSY